MPFLSKIMCNCKHSKERIRSLQIHRALLQGMFFSHKKQMQPGRTVTPKQSAQHGRFLKRVSRNTSEHRKPKKYARASMTLESVCVLPLFLFAILNMYAAVNDIGLHVRMQTAMQQTGLSLARYAYAYEQVAQGSEILQSEMADVIFSQTYVKQRVEERVGTEYLNRIGVRGGADGVSFLQSDVLTEDTITLVATYRMDALFLPEQFSSFGMVNRVCLRGWTGYDNAANAEGNAQKELIVYVTKYGQVYHRSRNCYHLNITIRQTDYERLAQERNQNGGRYSACEYCGKRRESGVLYVTDDGDRYHTTAACGALTRTVRAISFSERGSRPPCSTCGGSP